MFLVSEAYVAVHNSKAPVTTAPPATFLENRGHPALHSRGLGPRGALKPARFEASPLVSPMQAAGVPVPTRSAHT
jgi:hypothetical protein